MRSHLSDRRSQFESERALSLSLRPRAGPPRQPRRLAAVVELYVPAVPGSISTSATSRPPLFVPHHADMKLLPLSVLKLRLFEFASEAVAAVSNEIYVVVSAPAR